jgi:hypothetical protein
MQKLVKLRKGEITVNSKPGEGSVFTFSMTLPTSGQCGHLNQLSLSMKRQPSDVDDDKLKGIRVLLVDSHPVRQVRDMKARYYMNERSIGNCCFGQQCHEQATQNPLRNADVQFSGLLIVTKCWIDLLTFLLRKETENLGIGESCRRLLLLICGGWMWLLSVPETRSLQNMYSQGEAL